MNWRTIESLFGVDRQSAGRDANQVVASLTCLEKHVGKKWIQNAIAKGFGGTAAIASLLEFVECLRITDLVKNGNMLNQKLITDFRLEGSSSAIAEAQVAIHLVSTGAIVEYEPSFRGLSRKPDFLARYDNDIVVFEVTRLELSAKNKEQWLKNQKLIGKKCVALIPCGSLDIYIMNPKITNDTRNVVSEAVKNFLYKVNTSSYVEKQVSQDIYLVYDGTGSVRMDRANPPIPSKSETVGFLVFDCKNDRSEFIKRRLNVPLPMVASACVVNYKSQDNYNLPKAVRVYRIIEDSRAMGKVIEESLQLPQGSPNIVVLNTSGTGLDLSHWKQEISRILRETCLSRPSAVWVRSGYVQNLHIQWNECIVPNNCAITILKKKVLERVLPSGRG